MIDLRGLLFMDVTGLKIVLHARDLADVSRRRLSVVVREGGEVRRVLEISGFDKALHVVSDISQTA